MDRDNLRDKLLDLRESMDSKDIKYVINWFLEELNREECNHEFLFEAVDTEAEDLINGDTAEEVETILCCNNCGKFLVIQDVAQGKSGYWI